MGDVEAVIKIGQTGMGSGLMVGYCYPDKWWRFAHVCARISVADFTGCPTLWTDPGVIVAYSVATGLINAVAYLGS